MSTKDVGWDDLSPSTTISCNNHNIRCELPKWGSDHQISGQIEISSISQTSVQEPS